jgi:hypothetical protein
MIQIYPNIDYPEKSPYGGGKLVLKKVFWQGIHTCIEALCEKSGQTVIADLPVGHAVTFPCIVNPSTKEIFCLSQVKKWLGIPLLQSINEPNIRQIPLTIEKFKPYSEIVILNCIDSYYGHALLKLFNAGRHLDRDAELGLVVIVQKNLRWLVPEGVAEIWSVDIPLSQAEHYYPSLDEQIHSECRRFGKIFVSKAYSHPEVSDISRFSRIQTHDHRQKDYRISFVWRNDRPWIDNIYVIEALKRLGLLGPLLRLQNKKIQKLFKKLRTKLPHARYTVVGLGTQTVFPSWIEDLRVKEISADMERTMCQVYSESKVIIGVHGSNMLLPSAHSGMTVDLMPSDRWSNIAQDIVYQESDVRLSSFRYRLIPISTAITLLAKIVTLQVEEFDFFRQQMRHEPDTKTH